jgi:molybdopterin synthase catalytic subunit
MNRFRFAAAPLDTAALRAELRDPACGGYAAFEGWVRDHNDGRRVTRLEYEAFEALALREGERVLAEACGKFGVRQALCVHRVGALELGAIAVWVGAAAAHRDEAFRACRYIIDEVKHRLPIWKKEYYENGDSGWVNCERCAPGPDAAHRHAGPVAAAGALPHAPHHGHDHGHGRQR